MTATLLNPTLTQQFKSTSSDAVHTTAIDLVTGVAQCTCAGWRFKRKGQERWCWHVQQLRTTPVAVPPHAGPYAPFVVTSEAA